MRGSLTHCPGCGVQLPDRHIDVPDRFNASGECFCAFSDLQCYTVAKRDPAFIHHMVANRNYNTIYRESRKKGLKEITLLSPKEE